MNKREAGLRLINEAGGMAAAALALGLTQEGLRNRLYEKRGQALSHAQWMELQALTGKAYYAEAVAAESGGSFVPHAVLSLSEAEMQQRLAEFMSESGHFVTDVIGALADGVLTGKELTALESDRDAVHAEVDVIFSILKKRFIEQIKGGKHGKS
ncbi:YmfL family putative regulatory protein [Undibacterium squillarum]|uniref:Uncharacterized protein n=1 Tax=Undibacterium squillarum TaxID=1131567 RepID=A0ABQ2Y225_9BURK|nr:YmfL family putative regulatory protein [Undibacterium squillarum]GGX53123.1 hypothetical protein GCM10010946_34640 [Undibacterium squillarum]